MRFGRRAGAEQVGSGVRSFTKVNETWRIIIMLAGNERVLASNWVAALMKLTSLTAILGRNVLGNCGERSGTRRGTRGEIAERNWKLIDNAAF